VSPPPPPPPPPEPPSPAEILGEEGISECATCDLSGWSIYDGVVCSRCGSIRDRVDYDPVPDPNVERTVLLVDQDGDIRLKLRVIKVNRLRIIPAKWIKQASELRRRALWKFPGGGMVPVPAKCNEYVWHSGELPARAVEVVKALCTDGWTWSAHDVVNHIARTGFFPNVEEMSNWCRTLNGSQGTDKDDCDIPPIEQPHTVVHAECDQGTFCRLNGHYHRKRVVHAPKPKPEELKEKKPKRTPLYVLCERAVPLFCDTNHCHSHCQIEAGPLPPEAYVVVERFLMRKQPANHDENQSGGEEKSVPSGSSLPLLGSKSEDERKDVVRICEPVAKVVLEPKPIGRMKVVVEDVKEEKLSFNPDLMIPPAPHLEVLPSADPPFFRRVSNSFMLGGKCHATFAAFEAKIARGDFGSYIPDRVGGPYCAADDCFNILPCREHKLHGPRLPRDKRGFWFMQPVVPLQFAGPNVVLPPGLLQQVFRPTPAPPPLAPPFGPVIPNAPVPGLLGNPPPLVLNSLIPPCPPPETSWVMLHANWGPISGHKLVNRFMLWLWEHLPLVTTVQTVEENVGTEIDERSLVGNRFGHSWGWAWQPKTYRDGRRKIRSADYINRFGLTFPNSTKVQIYPKLVDALWNTPALLLRAVHTGLINGVNREILGTFRRAVEALAREVEDFNMYFQPPGSKEIYYDSICFYVQQRLARDLANAAATTALICPAFQERGLSTLCPSGGTPLGSVRPAVLSTKKEYTTTNSD